MACTSNENIVIGTLLNDSGADKFFEKNRISLHKNLFRDKKNQFIFGVIQRMYSDGCPSTTPFDVLSYCNTHGIAYGNVQNFCTYMTELADKYYEYNDFQSHLRELVTQYVREQRYGTR